MQKSQIKMQRQKAIDKYNNNEESNERKLSVNSVNESTKQHTDKDRVSDLP